MENNHYSYNGKSWEPIPTMSDYNSFFHSAFGVKTDENGYFDKLANFRRMQWITFLTYFEYETMPFCLTDTLRKCFPVNEKCKNVCGNDKQNLTMYISDLKTSEQAITKEEVAILATLENTKVVILSNDGLHPVTVTEPNPNIFGNYPKEVSKEEPKEVVLYLEGNIFTKLEPVREEQRPKPIKNKVQKKKTDPTKYRKSGSAGSKGVEYQISLIAMVMLNAMKSVLNEWKLSTENDEAGKFDDIVLEWTEGAVLIQSKHKEKSKKRITLEELTSTNSKNDDFSLPKYFLSYMLIKDTFNVKNVILCTNAGIHEKALNFFSRQMANTESLLHYEDGECSFYTHNDAILPDLKEKTIEYYSRNFKNKDIEESVITEENLTNFLNKFQLYFNYPTHKSLQKITENLLSSISCCSNPQSKVTSLEMYSKLMDWFQQKEGVYFTDIHAKAMFAEIWTDKYCQKLLHHKVYLQKNYLNFHGQKRIFLVPSSHGNLLQAIKVYYAVQNEKKKTLCVNPDDDIVNQKLVFDAFTLDKYAFLIINQLKVIEESVIIEICAKLKDILFKKMYKKVILMTRNNDVFSRCLGHGIDYEIINESVTFADFSKDFQEKLFKTKSIVFQGKSVCLEELLGDQTTAGYVKATDQILENIITSEVKVGVRPLDMDENIAPFYINRTFMRPNESIHEEDIYDVKENVVLISDSAGVGKTTVLSKLATDIKERNPHLWVIKIALTEYTHILRDLKNGAKSISIMELLNSKNATKLTNDLERFVFYMEKKVILMMDGIDEIIPDYTKLVLNLLTQCLQATNFAKLFVTTRPHMTNELRKILKVDPLELQPFAQPNQVDFLIGYWTHKLDRARENKEKCKEYAIALIDRILSWTKVHRYGEEKFTSIALQLRMLAEIFLETITLNKLSDWESCAEYLESANKRPHLPGKIELKELYDLFIERKRHIYIQKGNPSGNSEANTALNTKFNESLAYHKRLAREVILSEEHRRLFSTYKGSCEDIIESVLKVEIVQSWNEGFNFIHKTFAEYFVAESLVGELQLQSSKPNLKFQEFFIDNVLDLKDYEIIRAFLDSFLQNVVHSIPLDIFNIYQSDSTNFSLLPTDGWVINLLAKEGCVAILQLVLRCIDFETIKAKTHITGLSEDTVATTSYYNRPMELEKILETIKRENMAENTLNALKIILQDTGLEVWDSVGRNPLLTAAAGGHLKIVMFLIELGAKVNSADKDGFTALHLAVGKGDEAIVKHLVQHGAEIDCKNRHGYTPLHVAAVSSDLACAKCLLKSGADITIGDNQGRTILHFSAMGNRLYPISYLLTLDLGFYVRSNDIAIHLTTKKEQQLSIIELVVERDGDINIKNRDGCTPLHTAIKDGHLDTVKFLRGLGGDLNIRNNHGQIPLHWAAECGRLDSVKYLIKFNKDVDIKDNDGCTPLLLAASRGHVDVIKFLQQHNANVDIRDDRGKTLLHVSAANGCIDEYFVKCVADINTRDNTGYTALHLAAEKGRSHAVKFLFKMGVELNSGNSDDKTPLHLAAARAYLKTVKTLCEVGAQLNIRDSSGRTALHSAAASRHLNVVNYLFERGADLNVKDNRGRAALHSAASSGRLDIVKYLLEAGADVSIKDEDARTPSELAGFKRHFKIVDYFENIHKKSKPL